jgi:glycyl-tRNA synthetase beta chain
MAEFLLELFCEEIPAGMQAGACADLERLLKADLDKAGLGFGAMRSFATPRRLTLVIDDVASKSPDIKEEKKGPRVGAPEKAIEGFLRGAGLASLDQCRVVEDKKGDFYVADMEKPGRPAADILAESLPAIIRAFPWPKSMRWGAGKLRWVRPLHSILAVLSGKVVPFEVDGLVSGSATRGHRFMAPDSFKVKSFADYEERLKAAFVMLRPEERRAEILKQAKAQARKAGLALIEDEGLLFEAAGLVEWPTVLMGTFDESFLSVPPEVLKTSMRAHQKCFSLQDPKSGKFANRFLLVSNLVAKDKGKAIINGNERVIRARLTDAAFFWDHDRFVDEKKTKRRSLDELVAKLDSITFHEKLGTQGQRVKRIEALARELAPLVGADPDAAARAAHLCKADLVSEMVGEFPELQGLMGRYYALEQGEPKDIAFALEEHYMPKGASDNVPTDPVSVAVALADKLDILFGFWTMDEKPTGSKDPFALRRAALGYARICLQDSIRISLRSLFLERKETYMAFTTQRDSLFAEADRLTKQEYDGSDDRLLSEKLAGIGKGPLVVYVELLAQKQRELSFLVAVDELIDFLTDRLKVYMRDRGARYDLIDAVYALGGQDDLLMIVKRVEALGEFLSTDDGKNLQAGVKRAINILAKEERKDGATFEEACDDKLLQQAEEKDLFKAMQQADAAIDKALGKEDFIAAMQELAKLRQPVDAFFDQVTVNADEPKLRVNRLRLLANIRRSTKKVADFSRIEG